MINCSTFKDLFQVFKTWFGLGDTKIQSQHEGYPIDQLCRFKQELGPVGIGIDRACHDMIRQIHKYVGNVTLGYAEPGLIALAMCFVDPKMPHLCPDWYAYLSKEIIRSLGFQKTDGNSLVIFCGGWSALVELMRMSYLIQKAQMGEGGSWPVIEPAATAVL
ncbi:hypothetical protein R1flu_000963 [Riccia fluitans]|uniref:Uncharacterized protein n=1 Tax=Riccia fluitans TaxID=41844 RepID=A0ABD1Y1W7_9MARC